MPHSFILTPGHVVSCLQAIPVDMGEWLHLVPDPVIIPKDRTLS